ncbi:MAG: methyltransferase domain-containing protein [Coriobacteriales bacterium]|jgi:ubiquinone/menaquinone biosynthesis C-methylase UbiE|nr:methyltransferase domain-containing protein [Coriobacteriales bacterium]
MSDYWNVDWRQAWIDYNRSRKPPDDSAYWDNRAPDFAKLAGASPYADTFIAYLAPAPGTSLLDMGCGSGTLALPLARAGHPVYARDFSAGMLDALQQACQREGLENVELGILDFNAPWEQWLAAGLSEGCVDIALASRSTMVDDLWEALEKLERTARQRVAVTVATEHSPRKQERLAAAAGLESSPYLADYVYAVNILMQMGRYPQLRYIDSEKKSADGTLELIRWAWLEWEKPR